MSRVNVRPTIENVDTLNSYSQNTPDNFSLQENPILYGGGRNWKLSFLETSKEKNFLIDLIKKNDKEYSIDLFILNSSLILWFLNDDFGINLNYQNIILHAIKKNNKQLNLYLQIKANSEEDFVEVYLSPNNEIVNDELFSNKDKSFDQLINDAYIAFSKCSGFHFDEETDEETEPMLEIPIIDNNDEEIMWDNNGQADDINNNECNETNDSGIEVVISKKVSRKRDDVDDDDNSDNSKIRKRGE